MSTEKQERKLPIGYQRHTTAAATALKNLRSFNACRQAIVWAEQYTDPQTAWNECQRGDWMLWLLGNLSGKPESDQRNKLVLCACACARLALPHTKDPRVLTCIETAEAWAKGKVLIGDLVTAADAASAYAAASAAAASAAAAAAKAAADAAFVYAADAVSAYAAASAAAADAASAYAAYAACAEKKALSQCADMVRQHYPTAPNLTGVPA